MAVPQRFAANYGEISGLQQEGPAFLTGFRGVGRHRGVNVSHHPLL